jgi:hypothetical protein
VRPQPKDMGNVGWHQVRLRSADHFKEFKRSGMILTIQAFRQHEIAAPVQPGQDIGDLELRLGFQLRRSPQFSRLIQRRRLNNTRGIAIFDARFDASAYRRKQLLQLVRIQFMSPSKEPVLPNAR